MGRIKIKEETVWALCCHHSCTEVWVIASASYENLQRALNSDVRDTIPLWLRRSYHSRKYLFSSPQLLSLFQAVIVLHGTFDIRCGFKLACRDVQLFCILKWLRLLWLIKGGRFKDWGGLLGPKVPTLIVPQRSVSQKIYLLQVKHLAGKTSIRFDLEHTH